MASGLPSATGRIKPRPVPATLDHLLWGHRDLDEAVDELSRRSGVRAVFAGVHPELGTQNALARIDERVFLEVIAPAPRAARRGARSRAGAA
jgi:hypothetical protein